MIQLSILTPAIPERLAQVTKLHGKLAAQIGEQEVEHLIFCDNRKRTVGEKRQTLLDAAHGKYVAFVDDDDDVSTTYIQKILEAAKQNPDVITFSQVAEINGVRGDIIFGKDNPQEDWEPLKIRRRKVWHVCAWRRTIALQSSYPAINYGEDWAWAADLQELIQTEVHIPEILHFYRYSDTMTAAPWTPPHR